MKQCVLPVAKPYITHTPVIANMLSILQTNPNTESWIANHFVNIFINRDGIFDNFYDRNMFFYGCPWLQVNQIRREVVLRICHRITDYVKALLAEGFYVMLLVTLNIFRHIITNITGHIISLYMGMTMNCNCFIFRTFLLMESMKEQHVVMTNWRWHYKRPI